MDLHPYDGVTRRFRHDDVDQTTALQVIARVVPLLAPPKRLLYDLSFYSGGMGIFDHLRISVEMDPAPAIAGRLPWAEASEDILWLVCGDGETPREAALRAFIDENKAPFQPTLGALDVWFSAESGVNSWELVYLADGCVHYLAYDQG